MTSKFAGKQGIIIVNDYAVALDILSAEQFHVPDLLAFLERLEQASATPLPTLKLFVHNSPFFLEGDRHAMLRSLCLKHLGQRGLQPWNAFISQTIERLLTRAARHARLDLITDLAHPIFSELLRPIIGLYPANSTLFDQRAMVLQRLIEPMLSLKKLSRVDAELAWLLNQIRAQHTSPEPQHNTLLAQLFATQQADLSDDDKRALAITLYAAVAPLAQTVTNLLVDLYAAGHQTNLDQHDLLNKHFLPAAAPLFVHRIASSDCRIGNYTITQGNTVLVDIGQASRHRCPVQGNDKSPHFAFGYGEHYCVGAQLSRRIINELVPRFCQRFPNLFLEQIVPDNSNSIAKSYSTIIMRQT